MTGLFKMGLTAERAAQKIVTLQDKTVPELRAALEQAKQASLTLRKSRIMGEKVDEKQIQEADRTEENIRRELSASESAVDDLTALLRDMKFKENERNIAECETKMQEMKKEGLTLKEKILKVAAAYKAAVFERDGEEMPLLFAAPIYSEHDEGKMFDEEFRRLVSKEKPLEVRQRMNFELFQALRNKTAVDLADEEIAKAREQTAVPVVV